MEQLGLENDQHFKYNKQFPLEKSVWTTCNKVKRKRKVPGFKTKIVITNFVREYSHYSPYSHYISAFGAYIEERNQIQKQILVNLLEQQSQPHQTGIITT